jgi:hypothetical protein
MPVIKEVAPGRLEIREGGGCLAIFGAPFLAVGIWASLATLGLVTMRSDGQPATQAAAALFAVLFTLVGGVLVFGRSVSAIDLGQRVVTKQWRILLPVRTRTYQLGDFTTVTLTFVAGDSDSADKYPIGLKGNGVAPLALCSPTQYAEARRCATAVARHLGFDIEDSSTDHLSRVAAGDVDAALQDRLGSARPAPAAVERPPVLRSDVTTEDGSLRIAIPMPPVGALAVIGGFFPAAVAITMLMWLGFFARPRPLAPIEWIFGGLLFAGFGVLPVAGVIGRWLRSRVGRTIVTVSTRELRVQGRGIFLTRSVATFPASEILDVDYSTKESMMTSARRHAQEQTATMRRIPSSAATAGPNTEWVFGVLSRFLKGKGIVVKTRTGLTTFGEGLSDEEIQYLHAIVMRALTGTAG